MTQVVPPGDDPLLDGRYRLGTQIGSGGVAEVFRAVDERLQRDVAIKLFRGTVADQLQRHEDEMRTLAGLDNPSLVTVFDAGTDPVTDRPYLVMQLVEGSTLAEEMRPGPLRESLVADIGAELADALAYVHARGLVHRDVKPANVLIAHDGRAYLADFGIARLVDAAHVTRTGDVLGTPAYLSPEQVSGEVVGPVADVYALGLVLLECLTGRRAYEGAPMEIAMARLTTQPEIPATLPPAWQSLLGRMTAREPSQRVDSAQAATVLHSIAAGDDRTVALPPATLPPAAATTSVMPAMTTVEPVPVAAVPVEPAPRSRSRAATIALLALVAVIAVIAVVVVLNRQSGGSATDCYSTSPVLTGQQEVNMETLERLACH